jgi:hypothetical protein
MTATRVKVLGKQFPQIDNKRDQTQILMIYGGANKN